MKSQQDQETRIVGIFLIALIVAMIVLGLFAGAKQLFGAGVPSLQTAIVISVELEDAVRSRTLWEAQQAATKAWEDNREQIKKKYIRDDDGNFPCGSFEFSKSFLHLVPGVCFIQQQRSPFFIYNGGQTLAQ